MLPCFIEKLALELGYRLPFFRSKRSFKVTVLKVKNWQTGRARAEQLRNYCLVSLLGMVTYLQYL